MLRFRLLALFSILFLSQTALFAQAGAGGSVLEKTTSKPVINANVKLVNSIDTAIVLNTLSDSAGNYRIRLGEGRYYLSISKPGYTSELRSVDIVAGRNPLGITYLIDSAKNSGPATIIGAVTPVKQNGDTTDYNAAAYKVNPDATAGDLIKKMPGITVENGKIMAQGEEVKKVTLDGKEYFGNDAQAALNNLPAEIVDRIQVFTRMSDQAQFTGFDDGQGVKSINIKTRTGKSNGTFGKVYAGYGTDNRYQSGLVYNNFKSQRRISLLGMGNNINIQNFSSQDLLGINSSSQGGGGPGGYRRSSPSDNFLTNQSGGISATQAVGLNYNDQWGKRLTIGANYFFNASQNNQQSQLLRNYNNNTNTELGQQYNENSEINASPLNHRFGLRLEYMFDSSNSIIYTPSFNWQNNEQSQRTSAINSTALGLLSLSNTNTLTTGLGWNLKNEILFKHKFKKEGRTISINGDYSINKKTTENFVYSINQSYAPADTFNSDQFIPSSSPTNSWGSRITYTEPISKLGQLQVDYKFNQSENNNNKSTFNRAGVIGIPPELDTTLSNKYNTLYTAHEPGIMYRYRGKILSIGAGAGFQFAQLNGTQVFPVSTEVHKTFETVLPRVFFNMKFSKTSNVRGMFRTSTNVPSVTQLQDVISTSNPLLLSTGNPNLKQEVARALNVSWNKSNPIKMSSFFVGISGAQTSHYIAITTRFIVNDTQISDGFTALRGAQFIQPSNLKGYWNSKVFGNYGFPIKKLKINANINGAYGYSETPGMVNQVQNKSNTQNLSGGLVLASNINENIDFTVGYFSNYYNTKNTTQTALNNNYFNNTGTARINYILKNKIVFSSDVIYTAYTGLSSSFNQNFWLWNAGIGYKFLKKNAGELRVSCFDILKQNRSINRTINATYIEDNFTKVLTQYFMLTFTYNFRKFEKGSAEPEVQSHPHGMPPGPPGAVPPAGKPPYQP
ncbi:MAG: outer membrane beta-barrel protein [Bacteroidia bacterium]|nr:outer membrane beta-barrel protein [Bacteroidia bacterium]